MNGSVVLYHADCPDGFGAAWSAWKKLGNSAQYIPLKPRSLPPEETYGKAVVYTLDYSFPKTIIEELLPDIGKLIIIDHHKTSEECLPLAAEFSHDQNHSGAVLAWKYFHPSTPVPTLLGYIEDVDLWNYNLPNSRELMQALKMSDYNFDIWDEIARDVEDSVKFQRYIEDGTILVQKMEKLVQDAVDNAEEIEFEGIRCLMTNSPFHVSEIGAALVTKMPPIALIWSRRRHQVIVSLRSNGTVDVSAIAQKYGGGGLQSASAFSWDEENFLRLRKKIV